MRLFHSDTNNKTSLIEDYWSAPASKISHKKLDLAARKPRSVCLIKEIFDQDDKVIAELSL